MWSPSHLDEMVDFVADFSGNQSAKMLGTKRGFSELHDDDGGVFGNKKGAARELKTLQFNVSSHPVPEEFDQQVLYEFVISHQSI
ncbi:hypothetical protein Droror1_Dr00012139 [Drosera rotundifolia]